MSEKTGRQALIVATIWGAGAQLAVALAGHWVDAVDRLSAVLGLLIAVSTGFLYGLWAPRPTPGGAAAGGALAGGLCALAGLVVSWALGDVSAWTLAVGALASALAGVPGGLAGRFVALRAPV